MSKPLADIENKKNVKQNNLNKHTKTKDRLWQKDYTNSELPAYEIKSNKHFR